MALLSRRSLVAGTFAYTGLRSVLRSAAAAEEADSHSAIQTAVVSQPMLSPAEYLMHATVRIECTTGQGQSVGTGFLFHLFHQGDQSVPVIITNKHVIKGATTGTFLLTAAKEDGTPDLLKHLPIHISDFEQGWRGHPDPDVDLAIFPCAPMLQQITQSGQKVFWVGLDRTVIPTEEALQDLTPVEEVLIVGYPMGIWDTTNNVPVFRRGITATAPYLDFSGKKEFLIDAAIFPGSSGSPVMLYSSGPWIDRHGTTTVGGQRIQLLGVNYAVATYSATGELRIDRSPTQVRAVPVLSIPSNLGVCLKSSRILEFEPFLVQSGLKPPEGYTMRSSKP